MPACCFVLKEADLTDKIPHPWVAWPSVVSGLVPTASPTARFLPFNFTSPRLAPRHQGVPIGVGLETCRFIFGNVNSLLQLEPLLQLESFRWSVGGGPWAPGPLYRLS